MKRKWELGTGVPVVTALFLWVLILSIGAAFAQTPNPVTPGYQVCTNASGVTRCSFQVVGSDNVLGVFGLPMGAKAVTSCGAESYTNGVPYVLEQDLTGKLCTNATGGGGGGAVTLASGAVASGAYSSGSIASGAYASGAFSSGAFAAGSYAAGSIGSGALTDLGAQADAVCGTAAGTCSLIALVKYNNSVNPILGAGSVVQANIVSGGVASGAIASGALASGSIASGAVASGAFASGAFATGSFLNATAGDPCMFQAKTNVPISTASGTLALVTGVSAKKIYVCSLSLVAAGAIAISLSEGSSSTCGTSAQAGVMGVATSGTAANGMSFAANGGISLGNGGGTVASTATNANYLCLFQSGTTQIAGNLTYVQQ